MVKNWTLSKIAFISFCGGMLKSKNLEMGTSSKPQLTLERLVAILPRQKFQWAFCLFYSTRGLKNHKSDRN